MVTINGNTLPKTTVQLSVPVTTRPIPIQTIITSQGGLRRDHSCHQHTSDNQTTTTIHQQQYKLNTIRYILLPQLRPDRATMSHRKRDSLHQAHAQNNMEATKIQTEGYDINNKQNSKNLELGSYIFIITHTLLFSFPLHTVPLYSITSQGGLFRRCGEQ